MRWARRAGGKCGTARPGPSCALGLAWRGTPARIVPKPAARRHRGRPAATAESTFPSDGPRPGRGLPSRPGAVAWRRPAEGLACCRGHRGRNGTCACHSAGRGRPILCRGSRCAPGWSRPRRGRQHCLRGGGWLWLAAEGGSKGDQDGCDGYGMQAHRPCASIEGDAQTILHRAAATQSRRSGNLGGRFRVNRRWPWRAAERGLRWCGRRLRPYS